MSIRLTSSNIDSNIARLLQPWLLGSEIIGKSNHESGQTQGRRVKTEDMSLGKFQQIADETLTISVLLTGLIGNIKRERL